MPGIRHNLLHAIRIPRHKQSGLNIYCPILVKPRVNQRLRSAEVDGLQRSQLWALGRQHMRPDKEQGIHQRKRDRARRDLAVIMGHEILLVHDWPATVYMNKIGLEELICQLLVRPLESLSRDVFDVQDGVLFVELAVSHMEDMILAGLLRALSYEIVEVGYLRPEEAASPAIADLGGSEVFLVDEIRKIAGFVHLVTFPCLLGAP